MNVSINTATFAEYNATPLNRLKKAKIAYSLNPFKRTLKEDEVILAARDSVGMIAGTEPLNQRVLSQLPRLKVISRCGVGIDNVDLDYAQKQGIKVFATPTAPADAVAELTIGLILNLLRQVVAMSQDLKSGVWKKQMGFLLRGKTVGIIGMGRIGQKTAQLLQPFGVEVLYYDIRKVRFVSGCQAVTLPFLLRKSDIVTVHAALGHDQKSYLGSTELAKMKKGSWLINVARGGAVDEQALYDALVRGHLCAAALDVFSQEPYQGPLKNLPQVILTPHIGSYALEARVQMESEAVDNLLRGLKK